MNVNLLWRLVMEYKRGVKTQEAWEKFLIMGEKEIDKLDKEIEKLDKEIEKLLLKKEGMESDYSCVYNDCYVDDEELLEIHNEFLDN